VGFGGAGLIPQLSTQEYPPSAPALIPGPNVNQPKGRKSMKTLLSIASAACFLSFASVPAHAKSPCDLHHLGYTKAQCDECSNMTWSISKVFPAGVCVSTTAPAPVTIGGATGASRATPTRTVCDLHHLGYTKAQCDECTNMTWSVSRAFPAGVCAAPSTGLPPPTIGGRTTATNGMPPAATSCTLTNWGGVTLPLRSPNFSGTGAPVTVCTKGYDLAKSQFQCSTGNPVRAFNYPNTNVSCNNTVAVGGNPQVTINGRPCCNN
jgi:hypothetical protein